MRARQSAERGRQKLRAAARSRAKGPKHLDPRAARVRPLFKSKTVNWMYQTEPEPGLDGRTVFQPRGKVLGGSSSINGLLYVRGQHEDYDRWRQRGNDGWGYEDVLPYFKKAENQQRGPDNFHGVGGPLPVSDLTSRRSAVRSLHRRCRARPAFPTIPISTAPRRKAPDFSRPRRGTAEGQAPLSLIFAPPSGRKNLHVETSAAGAAHRVQWTSCRGGRIPQARRSAHARGRARKSWFRAAPTTRRNCCSSPASGLPNCCKPRHRCRARRARSWPRSAGSHAGPGRDALHAAHDAQRRRQQPGAQDHGRHAICGVPHRAVDDRRRHVGRILQDQSSAWQRPISRCTSCPSRPTRWERSCIRFSGFTASVCQLRPESRGSLRIRSADPAVPPEIRINYLATEVDRTTNVEGLKILRQDLGGAGAASLRGR